MPQLESKNIADYIMPLNINGMDGRMLNLPPPEGKSAEILFVYGHHSSIERWWGLLQVLNQYGAVAMPDLPGFGGMDSFYNIGKKPTIDNLADYLAAFIKLRYRRKRVAIAGMSFGFVIVTRMLQRYPELDKKVTLLISLVGFAHKDDFTFSRIRYNFYLYGCYALSRSSVTANLFRSTALNPILLRAFYAHTHNAKHKFADIASKEQYNRLMDMEVSLWRDNDVRTWAYTCTQFLQFDNCKTKIPLPVWHVSVEADNYFDNHLVEQHMRIIFTDFISVPINVRKHAPSVVADPKSAAVLLPPKLRRALMKLQ
jgi:pimeloyl-ACP methyl ester carboxylesterase